jgi:hypothetical protein
VDKVFIHRRVSQRHFGLSEQDVLDAWINCIRSRPRIDKNPDEYIAVGLDRKGRAIEMTAKRSLDGDWLIYHAMTPPSKKTLRELELGGDRNG